MEVTLATTSEIPPGSRKIFAVDNKEVVVINVDGEIHAFENYCPHMGGAVGNGPITNDGEECMINCPVHNWRFELDSGDVVFPAKKRIRKYNINSTDDSRHPEKLNTYDIVIDGDDIKINI